MTIDKDKVHRYPGYPWITDADGQLLCPMPECREKLYGEITSYIELNLDPDMGVVPVVHLEAQSSVWKVTCLNDHTILLPKGYKADNGEPCGWGEDYYYDDDNDEEIPIDDGLRLKQLFYALTP